MSGSADAFHSLTPRERDCLRLLRKGLLTPQVASTLGISVARLNKHLASARQNLVFPEPHMRFCSARVTTRPRGL